MTFQCESADRELDILVLANKPPGLAPNQRYRIEQWAPRLARRHGIRLKLVPFESAQLAKILYEPGHFAAKAAWVTYDFLRRAKVLRAAQSYDAVVISREAALIGPAIYERLLARTGKPIIYDFDDSIWSPAQERTNGIFSRLHFHGKTSSICQLATAVTAGNEFLAQYARNWNESVFVVPSSIELDEYPLIAEPPDGRQFVVCWTGSNSTLAHFEYARPALEQLAKCIPLTVKVVCNRPPEKPIAGAEMRFAAWSADREAQELGDCHVGIMPLPDDEVTRGKCGMKALQFMAIGRPIVVSAVGVNNDIVEHGKNGFLAQTPADFAQALIALSQDAALRRQMGSNARRTVEQRYSAEIVSKAFATVVRSVVS